MATATAIETSVSDDQLDPELIDNELDASDGDPEVETRARDLGWHPFAEYNGPPGKWVDAKTFIERGETILPIVRAQNHRLEEKVKQQGAIILDLRKTAQEQVEILQEMRDKARNADERGYQRALKDLNEKRQAAVVAGDPVAFSQIEEQIDELEETRTELKVPAKTAPNNPAPPTMDPAIAAFAAANSTWWNVDPFLSQAMVAEHQRVMLREPNATLARQLDKALANLKSEFPDRFDGADDPAPAAKPRPRASTVSAPTNAVTPRRATAGGIDTIADPKERQEARDAFSRTKRHIADYTEAEFMAVYSDPKADVLEIRKSVKGTRNGN